MLTFNNPSNVDDASNALLELNGATGVTTAVVNGTTYVFVAGNVDDGISVFSLAANGTLTGVFNIDDASNAALELDGAVRLTTAVIGGTTYLFAAGNVDDGISVFSVANNGALTNVFNVTTLATRHSPRCRDGHRDRAVRRQPLPHRDRASPKTRVSVFSVAANGALTQVSSVIDDATLELDGAAAVTTAIVSGITYVFVAGAVDDGVSTFRLNTDGSLTNIAAGNVTDCRRAGTRWRPGPDDRRGQRHHLSVRCRQPRRRHQCVFGRGQRHADQCVQRHRRRDAEARRGHRPHDRGVWRDDISLRCGFRRCRRERLLRRGERRAHQRRRTSRTPGRSSSKAPPGSRRRRSATRLT